VNDGIRQQRLLLDTHVVAGAQGAAGNVDSAAVPLLRLPALPQLSPGIAVLLEAVFPVIPAESSAMVRDVIATRGMAPGGETSRRRQNEHNLALQLDERSRLFRAAPVHARVKGWPQACLRPTLLPPGAAQKKTPVR